MERDEWKSFGLANLQSDNKPTGADSGTNVK
jgi:hypothetical protein